MKLFEVFHWLYEMAFSRKDIEGKITSLSLPIVKHLIKVLKWQDDQKYDKHLKDINSWIYDIQGFYIKGNRKPNQYDYFNWMFEDVVRDERTCSRYIKGLHQYHSLPVIRTDEEVFNMIKAILYNVSFDLHINDFDDIRDYL